MPDSKALMDAINTYMDRVNYIEKAQSLLDDPQRLGAVRQVSLNQKTADCLNVWCREAATLLNAPSSVVTIVGPDAQDVVAGFGVSDQSVPRDRSLCIFVAASGQQFDINNLAEAEKSSCFAYSEGQVRAYLGSPIKIHGQTVGSFCVVDFQPREWTPTDRYLIQTYAEKTSRTLEEEMA